jgi:hypothetical protein
MATASAWITRRRATALLPRALDPRHVFKAPLLFSAPTIFFLNRWSHCLQVEGRPEGRAPMTLWLPATLRSKWLVVLQISSFHEMTVDHAGFLPCVKSPHSSFVMSKVWFRSLAIFSTYYSYLKIVTLSSIISPFSLRGISLSSRSVRLLWAQLLLVQFITARTPFFDSLSSQEIESFVCTPLGRIPMTLWLPRDSSQQLAYDRANG